MSENPPPVATQDAAWATVRTPLDSGSLLAFCQDVERLLRINPMLEFLDWQDLGDRRYRYRIRNSSQQPAFETAGELRVSPLPDGVQIDYSDGLKSQTRVKIEPDASGSRLTLIDCYDRLTEQDREARLGEVDKSLTTWASYLQRYLLQWQRWSRWAPWRWYMRRIWQPMKPAARRITYMLLWISVVEVALIGLGVAIYFAEYA